MVSVVVTRGSSHLAHCHPINPTNTTTSHMRFGLCIQKNKYLRKEKGAEVDFNHQAIRNGELNQIPQHSKKNTNDQPSYANAGRVADGNNELHTDYIKKKYNSKRRSMYSENHSLYRCIQLVGWEKIADLVDNLSRFENSLYGQELPCKFCRMCYFTRIESE